MGASVPQGQAMTMNWIPFIHNIEYDSKVRGFD